MDSKSWTSWRRGLCCVLVPLAGAALADEKPRPLEGAEKVSVTFDVLASWKERATTRFLGWGPFELGVGDQMASLGLPSFAFGVGGGTDGCGGEAGTATPENALERQPYAWTADVKVLEASTDRLALSASWKRFTRGARGEAIESAAESIPRLIVREGERVMLDFIAVPLAASACARNYSLELTAAVREDPALAERQIAYDLWLVHETSDGARSSERARITVKHGEKTAFAFPKAALPASAGGRAEVLVNGQLRGRIRDDGTVDLALSTYRAVIRDGGVSGATGEKWLRVRPSDAIRVELPASPDAEGHGFALIVTAKPL